MRERAIGVFDSGIGGLTALRILRDILPGENFIYFGDTKRVPYGGRGSATIQAFARQDIAFLLSLGVKAILAACGTVSSVYPPQLASGLPVAYTGVVQPAAAAAAAATKNGRVGIIGTQATIATNSYQAALAAIQPGITCTAVACPLFVPLVEDGHFAKGNKLALLAAQHYLPAIKSAQVDTLILGCTHYPLLAHTIAQVLGENVVLIDAGKAAATALKESLAAAQLLRPGSGQGSCTYYVSDEPARFSHFAGIFLGGGINAEQVRQVCIEEY